jgi:sigma-B regulation protein RsbU (phosphoserine phosphatase)
MPMSHGFPLGIMDRLNLDVQQVKIKAGETLFIYTDGVTDGINLASGSLEVEGLLPILIQGAKLEAQAFCEHVLEKVYDLQGGQPQFDDLTLVAIQAQD